MARPERNNVDYFPFLCKEGRAMFYIEQKYGNDGYASWVKILRQLAVTNYHFLNLSDKIEFMYLSSKCKVTEETLRNIIQDLCDLKEFDNDLWVEYNIVFCEKFIESIQDAYKGRNNNCITLEGLLTLLPSLGVTKLSYGIESKIGNTHTIVKKTIVKNTKEEFITPPKGAEIDFDKFIETFNSFASRGFRVTNKVKAALKARLKSGYTRKEILLAIKNAHNDKYHIESGFKDLTPEFILREEKLEKYLNKSQASITFSTNGTHVPTTIKIDHSNRD